MKSDEIIVKSNEIMDKILKEEMKNKQAFYNDAF